MGSSGRHISVLDCLSLPYFYRTSEILELLLKFKEDLPIEHSNDVCGEDWREKIDTDIKSLVDLTDYSEHFKDLVNFIQEFHFIAKDEIWCGPLGRGFDDTTRFLQYFFDTFPKLLPYLWDHKFHRDSKWFHMKRPADSLPHQIFKMFESGIQKERDRGALTRYTCTNGQDKVEIEVFDINPYLSLYNKRFGSVLKIEENEIIRIYTSQDQLRYRGKSRCKVNFCVCVGADCLKTLPKCDRIVVFLSTKVHENFRKSPGNFPELDDIPYTVGELSDSARRKVKTYLMSSTKQDSSSLSGKVQREILATASVGKLTTGDLGNG